MIIEAMRVKKMNFQSYYMKAIKKESSLWVHGLIRILKKILFILDNGECITLDVYDTER